jgi:hypothetical protein
MAQRKLGIKGKNYLDPIMAGETRSTAESAKAKKGTGKKR